MTQDVWQCSRTEAVRCMHNRGGGGGGGYWPAKVDAQKKNKEKTDYLNILSIFWDSAETQIPSGCFTFVLSGLLIPTFLPLCAISLGDHQVSYRQQLTGWIKMCLPQSSERISITRTRLKTPRECVGNIMLHCQRLRQYCALLIIDLVAGISFRAPGIMFTVLQVKIHRRFFKAMNV